jgi:hypothetical protein
MELLAHVYSELKKTNCAGVLVTIYVPLTYTAPHIMPLMRANPLRGPMLQHAHGPQMALANDSMPFHRAQKVSTSRAQPPPTCPSNGFARIKSNMYRAGSMRGP